MDIIFRKQIVRKIMEVLMVVLFMGSILGLDNLQEKPVKINIYNVSQTSKLLTFDYELKNLSKLPIWICQYTSIFTPLQCEIQIDKDKKIVKIRQATVRVPDNVYLEEIIYSKYIKIKENDSYRGQVKLELPLQEIKALGGRVSNCTKKFLAKKIIFEIGIIQKDLLSILFPIDDDFFSNSIISEDTVYVNCFWVREEKPELIIDSVIENISVPYCE